jgi:hypothetical protein
VRPRRRAPFHILGALALLILAPIAARAAAPASGAYEDGLLLGYDPATRVVTGYFSMEQGDPPTFSCIFFLKGTLAGSAAPITTYFPETPKDDVIKGQLLVGGPKAVTVRLPSEHGGCWNVWHFADKAQPADFALDKAAPWIAVAVVRSPKAYFYDAPDSATHRKAHAVKGDGVGVRAFKPGWLQVDYAGGAKTISGWFKQSDVYPAR